MPPSLPLYTPHMRAVFALVFLCLCCVHGAAVSPDEPRERHALFDIRRYLGSKAPYMHLTHPASLPPQCRPVQVHVVARHGTRNPSEREITAFDALAAHLKRQSNSIAARDAALSERLMDWKCPFHSADGYLLVERGEIDHYQLAQRALKRYESAWPQHYHPLRFDFRASDVSRSSQSAHAYAIGLFEGKGVLGATRQQPIHVSTRAKNTDPGISPHESCPRYERELNDPKRREQSLLLLNQTLPRIVNRLKKDWKLALTERQVSTLYKLCAFEVSLFDRRDTFCALLASDEIETLNFAEDLREYYAIGYGMPMSRQMSCSLLSELRDEMQRAIHQQSGDAVKSTFRFGHKPTIVFLAMALDDGMPLMANMTRTEILNRQFRMSELSPFAGNFHIELHACQQPQSLTMQDSSTQSEFNVEPMQEYFVRILMHEQPIAIPGCETNDDALLCPWTQFYENILKPITSKCNWAEMCA